jgi:hypothetical protein
MQNDVSLRSRVLRLERRLALFVLLPGEWPPYRRTLSLKGEVL